MPQFRGQSFNELQYVALALMESTLSKLVWEEFKDAIALFTQSDEDTRTVLQLIDKAVITVEWEQA